MNTELGVITGPGQNSFMLLVVICSHYRATGNDEMCNFYIMFYTNSTVMNPSGECGGVQIRELVDNMPADSDVTLPPNPLLDEVAHGHHHHGAMAHSSTPGAEHVAPTGVSRSSASCSSLIHSQPGLLWVRAFPTLPFSVGPCVPDLIHLYI